MGSNIFNVLLILGITSFVSKLFIKKNKTWMEIPLSIKGAVLVLVVVSDKILGKYFFKVVSRMDGVVLLSLALVLFSI